MCGNLFTKGRKNAVVESDWSAPRISDPNEIPKGDMPGDKIQIGEGHIVKANAIFPKLLETLLPALNKDPNRKVVISVHGGSGVGKSEIGSLLAYYFNCMNIGCYVLSGDNYPHRIPFYNDAERYRIFRTTGIKALVAHGEYTAERKTGLAKLQEIDSDANPECAKEHPWLAIYQKAGREALANYMGTTNEIDFAEVSTIISKFKNGSESIFLKRMGRELKDLWYDEVDFTDTKIMIIEWTHGNNKMLKGVDMPILLNSTPQETLEHRKSRNRDGGTESPFTTMVLDIEQNLLHSQSPHAKIIVARSGEIVSHEKYMELMKDNFPQPALSIGV